MGQHFKGQEFTLEGPPADDAHRRLLLFIQVTHEYIEAN